MTESEYRAGNSNIWPLYFPNVLLDTFNMSNRNKAFNFTHLYSIWKENSHNKGNSDTFSLSFKWESRDPLLWILLVRWKEKCKCNNCFAWGAVAFLERFHRGGLGAREKNASSKILPWPVPPKASFYCDIFINLKGRH